MHFKRDAEESFSFDLTPLIDVVFLLIIFFMVSTAFIDFTRRLDIELPESKAGAVAEERINYLIEMTVAGKLYLNGDEVTLEELEATMEKQQPANVVRSVVIKADRRLHFGKVVAVMGICKAAGIRDVGVAIK